LHNDVGNWTEKRLIWLTDKEHVYLAASVLSQSGDYLTIKLQDGTVGYNAAGCYTDRRVEQEQVKKVHVNDTEKMNHPKFDKVDDMADLGYLNEASVLHNLRLRYYSNLIYVSRRTLCSMHLLMSI
jgi:myosin protein heavy chain